MVKRLLVTEKRRQRQERPPTLGDGAAKHWRQRWVLVRFHVRFPVPLSEEHRIAIFATMHSAQMRVNLHMEGRRVGRRVYGLNLPRRLLQCIMNV